MRLAPKLGGDARTLSQDYANSDGSWSIQAKLPHWLVSPIWLTPLKTYHHAPCTDYIRLSSLRTLGSREERSQATEWSRRQALLAIDNYRPRERDAEASKVVRLPTTYAWTHIQTAGAGGPLLPASAGRRTGEPLPPEEGKTLQYQYGKLARNSAQSAAHEGLKLARVWR